jgi:hypothetical protein
MRRLMPLATLAAGLALFGCEDRSTKSAKTGATASTTTAARKHDHWWCREHGIPEDECLMCKLSEEELKKKGDWCEKHEYAKSQCFACNPALRERYAAQYRAKYGREPPEADENPGKPEAEPTKPEKR